MSHKVINRSNLPLALHQVPLQLYQPPRGGSTSPRVTHSARQRSGGVGSSRALFAHSPRTARAIAVVSSSSPSMISEASTTAVQINRRSIAQKSSAAASKTTSTTTRKAYCVIPQEVLSLTSTTVNPLSLARYDDARSQWKFIPTSTLMMTDNILRKGEEGQKEDPEEVLLQYVPVPPPASELLDLQGEERRDKKQRATFRERSYRPSSSTTTAGKNNNSKISNNASTFSFVTNSANFTPYEPKSTLQYENVKPLTITDHDYHHSQRHSPMQSSSPQDEVSASAMAMSAIAKSVAAFSASQSLVGGGGAGQHSKNNTNGNNISPTRRMGRITMIDLNAGYLYDDASCWFLKYDPRDQLTQFKLSTAVTYNRMMDDGENIWAVRLMKAGSDASEVIRKRNSLSHRHPSSSGGHGNLSSSTFYGGDEAKMLAELDLPAENVYYPPEPARYRRLAQSAQDKEIWELKTLDETLERVETGFQRAEEEKRRALQEHKALPPFGLEYHFALQKIKGEKQIPLLEKNRKISSTKQELQFLLEATDESMIQESQQGILKKMKSKRETRKNCSSPFSDLSSSSSGSFSSSSSSSHEDQQKRLRRSTSPHRHNNRPTTQEISTVLRSSSSSLNSSPTKQRNSSNKKVKKRHQSPEQQQKKLEKEEKGGKVDEKQMTNEDPILTDENLDPNDIRYIVKALTHEAKKEHWQKANAHHHHHHHHHRRQSPKVVSIFEGHDNRAKDEDACWRTESEIREQARKRLGLGLHKTNYGSCWYAPTTQWEGMARQQKKSLQPDVQTLIIPIRCSGGGTSPRSNLTTGHRM